MWMQKKIKIFVNDALVDFTDLVANQFVFLMIGQDMIPYPKKNELPYTQGQNHH
jgi:hypothetical protein